MIKMLCGTEKKREVAKNWIFRAECRRYGTMKSESRKTEMCEKLKQ